MHLIQQLTIVFSDSINALRYPILDELQISLKTLITTHLQHACKSAAKHKEKLEFCEHLSRTGHFLDELNRLSLWPIPDALHTTNLSAILDKLMDFKPYYWDIERDKNTSRYHPRSLKLSCSTSAINFKDCLTTMVFDSRAPLGLCLACVKQGKVTNEEGNCNAPTLDDHYLQEK